MVNANKIRVLVVDDSTFMRKVISMMIADDPMIEVIGTATNGEEGLQMVHECSPDLVTLDIEMPRMDGLTALRKIMREKPTPVMMVSSLTSEGAQATLDALDLGAVDFIPKQVSDASLDIARVKKDLIEKIKHIHSRRHILMSAFRSPRTGRAGAGGPAGPQIEAPRPVTGFGTTPGRKKPLRVIAVGASTGGPPALQTVVSGLPENIPVPILVVQHMPPTFTKSLAARLDSLSRVQVKEAEDGEKVEKGIIYVAPGDRHMTLAKCGISTIIMLSLEPRDTLYKPSVNIMMNSVADLFIGTAMGVILTGMGQDGLEGLKKIKSQGGVVIAQNEETCVVYGMPRAAVEAEVTDRISPIDRLASDIVSYF